MQGTLTGLSGPGFPLVTGGDGGTTGTEAYVVKLDATGKPVYAFAETSDPTAGASFGLGVAESGNTLAIGGYFLGTVDLGQGPVTSQGGYDGFVSVIDETSMKATTVAPLAGLGDDSIRSVALDAWGNLFLAGTYGDNTPASASLGTALLPQTTTGVVGMVLAKFDPTGKLLWSHPFVPTAPDGGVADPSGGDHQSIVAMRLRALASGEVAVAGEMSGGVDFGAGYQQVLSTLNVPTYCGLIISGGHSYCSCGARVPDGFVGVWHP